MMNENVGVRSVANWRARMAGCFFKNIQRLVIQLDLTVQSIPKLVGGHLRGRPCS